jgi:hypothetical protein
VYRNSIEVWVSGVKVARNEPTFRGTITACAIGSCNICAAANGPADLERDGIYRRPHARHVTFGLLPRLPRARCPADLFRRM